VIAPYELRCTFYVLRITLRKMKMSADIYQLHVADSSVFLSATDLVELALQVDNVIDERELRRRSARLTNRSLAEAIHAMLDQEEPRVRVQVRRWCLPNP
jgi:hypothetical protein